MSCETCKRTKPAQCCTNVINIDGIPNISASLKAYFKNVATGRLLMLAGSSSASGVVSINTSDQRFATNQAYELWLTLSSSDMGDRIIMTMDSITTECLLLTFDRVNKEEDEIDVDSSLTLELA